MLENLEKSSSFMDKKANQRFPLCRRIEQAALNYNTARLGVRIQQPALERSSENQGQFIAANKNMLRAFGIERKAFSRQHSAKQFNSAGLSSSETGRRRVEKCPLVSAFGNHDACVLQADEELCRLLPASTSKARSYDGFGYCCQCPVARESCTCVMAPLMLGESDKFWNSKRCHAH